MGSMRWQLVDSVVDGALPAYIEHEVKVYVANIREGKEMAISWALRLAKVKAGRRQLGDYNKQSQQAKTRLKERVEGIHAKGSHATVWVQDLRSWVCVLCGNMAKTRKDPNKGKRCTQR